MHDKFISQDRKMYLRKIRINKFAILATQIAIIISFIVLSNSVSFAKSFSILVQANMTVEWSRPPNSRPIRG